MVFVVGCVRVKGMWRVADAIGVKEDSLHFMNRIQKDVWNVFVMVSRINVKQLI